MPKYFVFGKKKRNSKKRGRHSMNGAEPNGGENDSCLDDSAVTVTDNDVSTESAGLDADQPSTSSLNDGHGDQPRVEKKMSFFTSLEETDVNTWQSYLIVQVSFLTSLLSVFSCPSCSGSNLTFVQGRKMGLSVDCSVVCSDCCSTIWSKPTSPMTATRHDINLRAVLASKETGVGFTKFTNLLSIMNIPNYMHHKTYTAISSDIHDAAVAAAENAMVKAAAVVRERHQASKEDGSTIPTVCVSYDGTWQKRGHSSHNGVGVAIELDTGLVLDTHVLSNYCKGCASGPKPESSDYVTWKANHLPVCQVNHTGSSNSMEMKAAEIIFSRSIATRELRYGTMLCDGDSKALDNLNSIRVYGDTKVIKEDCVNHIAKRMFNALVKLKRENKVSLDRKLTVPNIQYITNTYATNLRKHAPDVKEMKFGVMGGILHMASTDEQPNHRYCPQGEDSWCKYNRAKANNQDPPPHSKPSVLPSVLPFIYPIIQRLTDDQLLERCAKMQTQNANESFNSLIWNRCSKSEFASRRNVETAVALSVLAFNCGPVGLKFVMARLGLMWSSENHSHACRVFQLKCSSARKRTSTETKWKRRNSKRRRLQSEHTRQEKEGETYAAGGFNL